MATALLRKLVTAILFLQLFAIHFVRGVEFKSLCAELISSNGYPCEEITLETPDGFLLGLYHIPHGRDGPKNVMGPPVFLMHGILAAGDVYVSRSPEASLGFLLADSGYDVYIGNNRNVEWSRGSSKYQPFEKGYWDWTFDDLSAFDVPTMVDYIYNTRGGSKLFYVAHSQGSLSLFVGLAGGGPAAEQMKDKLRGAVLLGPVGYVVNLDTVILSIILTRYIDQIRPLLRGDQLDITALRDIFCSLKDVGKVLCEDLLTPAILGTNNYIDDERFTTFIKYFPQPCSLSNINHFAQVRKSAELRKFDRTGPENLKKYGQAVPPLYDLSKFPSSSFPQLYISGGIDQVADPTDVARLLRELPDTGNRKVINLPDYGHGDLVISSRTNLDIFPPILSFLQNN